MIRKKIIRELIHDSYQDNGQLSMEEVLRISDALKRSELKQYINALKNKERKESVVISLPFPPTEKEKEKNKTMFPNKKIIYEIDPSLFLGTRIQDNDMITEYSLKDSLENLQKHFEEDYDS